jgi:hypothetical protein
MPLDKEALKNIDTYFDSCLGFSIEHRQRFFLENLYCARFDIKKLDGIIFGVPIGYRFFIIRLLCVFYVVDSALILLRILFYCFYGL